MAPVLGSTRLEVMPLPRVLEQVRQLPTGSTVTVTASPRQGVAATVELCEQLADAGMATVPHLAARQIKEHAELADAVTRLQAAGVDDVFVVGGDASDPAGDFADGLALLRGLDSIEHGFRHIGVPSYPDGHHLIDDEVLWESLQAKQAYATYTVTQLCFDANAIGQFSIAARNRGIELPILAGVPGVVDMARLLRVSLRIGVGDSVRFVRGNRAVTARLLNPTGYRPDALLRRLGTLVTRGEADLAGLHIYTFNQVTATARWITNARRRTTAVAS